MKWQLFMHSLVTVLGAIFGLMVYLFIHGGATDRFLEMVYSSLLGMIVTYTVFVLNRQLDRLLPWGQFMGIRLLSGIVLSVITAFLVLAFSLYLYGSAMDRTLITKVLVILTTISLLYSIAYFIFYSFQQYTRKRVEEHTVQRLQKQLQFSTLKSQLSPHFLFNSLNALSSLFHRAEGDAEQFIRSLSNSLSFVLQHYSSSTVTVAEELELVNNYAQMMRMRFGNYLDIQVDLDDETLRQKIPPLSLQMLIENAIKHNHMNESSPLKVSISKENGYIKVDNNKNIRDTVIQSTKVGLQNIQERYKILSNRTIRIQNAEHFIVKLPLLA